MTAVDVFGFLGIGSLIFTVGLMGGMLLGKWADQKDRAAHETPPMWSYRRTVTKTTNRHA